jgi:DNA invertase Pin-like site-specific DNA recombinase
MIGVEEDAMRVAIYARVSTTDQTVSLQLDELRAYAKARGFEIVAEYVDEGVSGTKEKRPALDRLLADAHRRRFDVVLAWKLDRLGRSLGHLIRLVESLGALNVDLVSLNDPGLDTTSPHGKLVFSIMGAVAEFERSLTAERTRAGVAAARRRGKRLGRPRAYVPVGEARSLIASGLSVGVPRSTLSDALARIPHENRRSNGRGIPPIGLVASSTPAPHE